MCIRDSWRRARRGCGFRSGLRAVRRRSDSWRVDREFVRFGTGSRPVEIDPLTIGAALAPQGGRIGGGQEAHGEQENRAEAKEKGSAEAVQTHTAQGPGGDSPWERCSPGGCRDSRFRRATVCGEFSAHGVSIASPRFPCRALRSAARAYTAHTLLSLRDSLTGCSTCRTRPGAWSCADGSLPASSGRCRRR